MARVEEKNYRYKLPQRADRYTVSLLDDRVSIQTTKEGPKKDSLSTCPLVGK